MWKYRLAVQLNRYTQEGIQMKNTIFAVRGKANIGKTPTIK